MQPDVIYVRPTTKIPRINSKRNFTSGQVDTRQWRRAEGEKVDVVFFCRPNKNGDDTALTRITRRVNRRHLEPVPLHEGHSAVVTTAAEGLSAGVRVTFMGANGTTYRVLSDPGSGRNLKVAPSNLIPTD